MKNSYESYVLSFKEYLLDELNYAVKTGDTYLQVLKLYGEYLKINNLDFRYMTSEDAQKYKAYLIKEKYDNKTTSLHLSTLRTFYSYLTEICLIDTNPFVNLKNPKVARKLPNFLKESEIKIIINEDNLDNDLDIRNNFIMEFLYATGLRVSELLSLKISDLNFSDGSLRVMGKGSKERVLYFKACPKEIMDAYLKKARINILEGNKSEYLIVSKRGKPLSSRSVELIIKKYALKNGLKNKVTPHTFRHTFATDLLNNGADIRSVGELLGHESLSTTQIYTHVSSERLKEVYNKTHPRK